MGEGACVSRVCWPQVQINLNDILGEIYRKKSPLGLIHLETSVGYWYFTINLDLLETDYSWPKWENS